MEYVRHHWSHFYVFYHHVVFKSLDCHQLVRETCWCDYRETFKRYSSIFDRNTHQLYWHAESYFLFRSDSILVGLSGFDRFVLCVLKLLLIYGLLSMLPWEYESSFLVSDLTGSDCMRDGQDDHLNLLLLDVPFYNRHVQEVQTWQIRVI